jgi:hypothetical protein
MKRVIFTSFAFVFFVAVAGCSMGVKHEGKVMSEKKVIYEVNNKRVDQAAFDQLMGSLNVLDETYHCKKTIYGGSVSYDLKAKDGLLYSYRSEDKESATEKSLFSHGKK